MIEFKNIYKSFKDKHVLEDVSFSIDKGEFVCIIGPSGCGKTTALKMINRLIKPTRGAIYVDGKDISKEDEIDLRRNIGYVIQQTGLFPHMTVKENIELIPKLKNKKDPSLATKVVEYGRTRSRRVYELIPYSNEWRSTAKGRSCPSVRQ